MGDFLFGESPSVGYQQSPQQAQGWQMIQPMLQNIFGQYPGTPQQGPIIGYNTVPGQDTWVPGTYNWDTNPGGTQGYWQNTTQQTPIYGPAPTATTPGNLNLWNIPSYNVPTAYNIPQAPGPTAGWFNSLSPDVMKGLWEPYGYAANQLEERMGAAGSLGSARGGYSGAAGDAFGRFYSDAGKDIGLNAWNMMQPGLQARFGAQVDQGMQGWAAELGKNQNIWQQQLQQNQFPYNLIPSMYGQTLPNTVVNPGSEGLFQQLAPFALMKLL